MPVVPAPIPARGSLQSRAAATVGGLTLRPLGGLLSPEQPWGVWAARQIIAGVMDTFGPSLSGARVEPVDVRLPDGRRVVGEWVYGRPDIEHQGSAVYYLHGSGFVLCSPRTHRRLTAWLSRLTGLPVFCIDYRLAPEYRFPTAATDVRSGWDWLRTERGFAPDRIVMAGDSAGGHLAVDLLLQPDVPHPAALALFSPLFDMTFGLARTRDALRRDPAIRPRDAARLVGLYCSAHEMTHPGLTLDVRNGRALPPTLIQAGGAEMLLGDARKLHQDLRAAGTEAELQVWPDQVHVFQALPKLSPEARPAMRSASAFLSESLRRNVISKVAG
ncbi:MAG: alpha/beta hydrolase [Mycolicibacterium cosmeticum]|nr:alpha/beta hydrolase [Mycolicibacterium cosmeticum]